MAIGELFFLFGFIFVMSIALIAVSNNTRTYPI